MTEKIRILFLAANPIDTTQLRLDEEIREIHAKIRAAEFRDSFELISRWAVRPGDLIQAFNEVRPHIVHFSGHGTKQAQLVLEDTDGRPKPVSEAALTALFRTVKGNITLVVLNACHSETQATAISKEIESTVGMNDAIGDEAAIIFASTFYGALAFGLSVGAAYEQGKTSLMLNGIPEETTPTLLVRPGSDALRISFINRKPTNPVLPPIALEILKAAVADNSPINYVAYDGGMALQVGGTNFDCNFNLEERANLEHAVTMLVQVGWIKQTSESQYHVTHAGYAAARKIQGGPNAEFLEIKNQVPRLIAEFKDGLKTEEGKFVREFFVLGKKGHRLGGSSKPRFIFYEEDHENLRGMLDILENRGYLVDVTPGNTPIYRMTEEFVKLVLAD